MAMLNNQMVVIITIIPLVGSFNHLEKYKKSVGMIIPNIWKVIKFMVQTTNQSI